MNNEQSLIHTLITCHLEHGEVGLKGDMWSKTPSGAYCRLEEDGKERTWKDAEYAADDIILAVSLLKTRLDDVIFYANGVGTTWRMLKLDMPFLRIVLMNDAHAMYHDRPGPQAT